MESVFVSHIYIIIIYNMCGFTMKKLLRLVFCSLTIILIFQQAISAQQAGRQAPIKVPANIDQPNALLYLPWDYYITDKKYPLICFYHGSGEAGANLNKLKGQGLPYVIEEGHPPYSVDKVTGDTTLFIVLSIQATSAYPSSPTPEVMLKGITTLINDYHIRIDTNRIYPTGLSSGGGESLTSIMNYPYKFPAAVVMSPAKGIDYLKVDSFAHTYVWLFQSPGDHNVGTFRAYDANEWINNKYPGHSALYKYPGGHCCWIQFYEPSWHDDSSSLSIYDFMLLHDLSNERSKFTSLNKTPVARAGSNVTITLPNDSASMDGSKSIDPDGSIVFYHWLQQSGPTAAILNRPDAAQTQVTGLKAGIYVFSLTVRDDSGTAASTDLTLTVLDSTTSITPNQPPVAHAGPDQTVTLPLDSITLDGTTSSDLDGTIVSYRWSKVSGSDSYSIGDDTSAKTTVNLLQVGTYIFALTVTDDSGSVASDNVSITVLDSIASTKPNQPPVANAGPDQTVTLPLDSITLDGTTSSDSDDTIVSYRWSKVSGSDSYSIGDDTTAKTTVNLLQVGTYIFALTVTDNNGVSDTDDVTIVVKPRSGGPANKSGFFADAGEDIVTTMPINKVTLNAERTKEAQKNLFFISFKWEKISGPDQYTIQFPGKTITDVSGLAVGTYRFRFTATINTRETASDTIQVTVKPDPVLSGDVPYTANTYVPEYADDFQYGSNTGYYGNGWNDTAVAGAALSAGVHSLRLPLPDYFVAHYGYDVRINEFNYYTHQLGMKDLTLFVGSPRPEYHYDTIFSPDTKETAIFSHLYESIWDNGENGTPINDNNYFAVYIYNLVKRYGNNVKFWEIVNEPDMTGFWDNGNRGRPDVNWWNNPPSPEALFNIHAPVFYYIRMLHIAYEVIKKFDPDSYIAPGGIGYPAFLDILLRYSDNPDGGKITPQYPLTGGAYFDVLSFHCYPAYSLSYWDGSLPGFRQTRYSDKAAEVIMQYKDGFENILEQYGYNGKKYPKKPFILTETNISRKVFDDQIGSNIAQLNFVIKALVYAQKDDIKQLYLYGIADGQDYSTANSPYSLMGIYENLSRDQPGQQRITDEGTAYKTTSMLLYGWRYDSIRTGALNLPDSVGGAAFEKGNQYRYVLWAKTDTDLSEAANATYSFATSLGFDSLYRYEWNYSADPNAKSHIGAQDIALSGTPSFFTESKIIETDNRPPVADAGDNQTIMAPLNNATLNGSGSIDPDGIIVSYKWTKTAGPSSYSIDNINTIQPRLSDLVAGTYIFTLTVTDDKGAASSDNVTIIVNKAKNQYPIANAGVNQTITLPINSINLDGSASFDPDGTIAQYHWTQKSGPTSFSWGNTNSAKTTVSNLSAGTYIFTLTVKDNSGDSTFADVTILVSAHPNLPPKADAGQDITITLPLDSVVLDGSKSYDPDGTISGYDWEQQKGPSDAVFGPNEGASVGIYTLEAGTYVFALTVIDNKGKTATNQVTIIVKPAPNQPPVADAGNDGTITLPNNSVTLSGARSFDPDGRIVSYQWEKISGPDTYHIANPSSVSTQIDNLAAGAYSFALTVKDNKGATNVADVFVTVLAAPNQSPLADAGHDQSVTLPEDSVTLDGSASSDPDGKIISYQWIQKSGPNNASLSNESNAMTMAADLKAGTYVFTLVVTDNKGAADSADVTVTVNKPVDDGGGATQPSNQSPLADAGHDQSVTLPEDSVTLDGSASSDPDGKIISYQWIQKSGPSITIIVSNQSPVAIVRGLVAGTYVFKLTVSDNDKAQSSAEATVVVLPAANLPPVANAGNNHNIFLPNNSTILDGSASADFDGSIVDYQWSQESGPEPAMLTQDGTAKAEATGLINGIYVFTLVVTDNSGSKDTSKVTIGVYQIPNQAPVAKTEGDSILIIPDSSLSLNGSPSYDPDGTIVEFNWQQTNGPIQTILLDPSNAVCPITGLTIKGIYDFKLTVKDNNGATASTIVSIYVLPAKDTTETTFKIYPNPVHDMLHVELNKSVTGLLKFRIIDVNGRIRKVYEFGALPFHITKVLNVSALSNGVYFIQLIEDNQLRDVKKMLKY